MAEKSSGGRNPTAPGPPASVQKKPTRKPAKTTKRKKRRGKLSPEDGIRAALTAAVLIFAAALVCAAFFIVSSFTAKEPAEREAARSPESPEVPEVLSVPVQPGPAEMPPPPARPVAPAESAAPAESVVPVKPAEPAALRPGPGKPASAPPAPPRPEAERPAGTILPAESRRERPPEPVPKERGTLVFIIDDAGNNLRELEPFLRFPGPLTIAVLPGLPFSGEAARRIRAAGKEVFLHQPMEALGGQNPGPGAVYSGMRAGEVRAIVNRNLDEIGPAAGINNHQGSKGTMDAELVGTLLALCRERGIYFLDSRTTADTVVPLVAERLGIQIGERDVFLDNLPEKAEMIRSIQSGLERAAVRGSAVMIGHTWSAELAATLEELYPDMIAQGYSLSTVSRFMTGGSRGEDADSGY